MTETTPMRAGAIKTGDNVVLKGRPCTVTFQSTCKTGKHGHAKVTFIGKDLFTGNKIEDMCQSTHIMRVPVIDKDKYMLTGVDRDGYLYLRDDRGNERGDIKLPPDGDIRKKFDKMYRDDETFIITLLEAMGQVKIFSIEIDKP